MKTRLDELIEAFGDAVGRAHYETERTAQSSGRAIYLEQQRQLAEISAAVEAERRAATLRQAPLEAEMNRLNELWLTACEKLRAQQLADQSALVPLHERAAAINQEMARSPFEGRVRNWAAVPEHDMPQLQGG